MQTSFSFAFRLVSAAAASSLSLPLTLSLCLSLSWCCCCHCSCRRFVWNVADKPLESVCVCVVCAVCVVCPLTYFIRKASDKSVPSPCAPIPALHTLHSCRNYAASKWVENQKTGGGGENSTRKKRLKCKWGKQIVGPAGQLAQTDWLPWARFIFMCYVFGLRSDRLLGSCRKLAYSVRPSHTHTHTHTRKNPMLCKVLFLSFIWNISTKIISSAWQLQSSQSALRLCRF